MHVKFQSQRTPTRGNPTGKSADPGQALHLREKKNKEHKRQITCPKILMLSSSKTYITLWVSWFLVWGPFYLLKLLLMSEAKLLLKIGQKVELWFGCNKGHSQPYEELRNLGDHSELSDLRQGWRERWVAWALIFPHGPVKRYELCRRHVTLG